MVSELCFVDTLWPGFAEPNRLKAIGSFGITDQREERSASVTVLTVIS